MRFKNLYTTSPNDVEDGDALAVKIVAVARDGHWKAYRGPSDWSDVEVAMAGVELLPEQAAPFFDVLRNSERQYGGL